MTAKPPLLDHAKDLVSRELPRYLGPFFDIQNIVVGTFHHDDEDLVHITVYLKPGHPDIDPHVLVRFDDDMHDRFVGQGFARPPAISYSDSYEATS